MLYNIEWVSTDVITGKYEDENDVQLGGSVIVGETRFIVVKYGLTQTATRVERTFTAWSEWYAETMRLRAESREELEMRHDYPLYPEDLPGYNEES